VLVGPDGVFMVDATYAPLTDKVVAAIRKLSPAPFDFWSTRILIPIIPVASQLRQARRNSAGAEEARQTMAQPLPPPSPLRSATQPP